MKPIYLLLIAILFCQLLFAAEPESEILFPDHHLCLEAAGKVAVKADKAVFSFTVSGLGASLRDAVTNAKSKVAELTKELGTIGIGNESFATGSFTSGKNLSSSFFTDKKDYSASLTTTVTLRDLAKLDDAVLILTDKKAENLSYINYSLDDQSKARQQAREIALNRISEQRDTISRILGVSITDVLLIDEAPFEVLPWSTKGIYSPKGDYNYTMNTVTSSKHEGSGDEMGNAGGLYSPDVTVETQVRVLYRIGLKPAK